MPKFSYRAASTTLLAGTLMACSAAPDARLETAETEMRFVTLQQSAAIRSLTILPIEVVEDSRCPVRTTCVWAGRFVLTALITGPGWQQTVDLVLDEPQFVRGYIVALAAVMPVTKVEGETRPNDYRFAFEVEERT
ncbi:hypothetical protein [Pseudopontixanthobacter vadosimaris]|uniref:hypothetical protein n=1 Tax=Pseudopontixanthobacter vadosimaris TaxID=2726450 RepID=UPI0014762294|nr:hypothetical protein [Pseudopontixanthobacter vadosimaris]